MMQAQTKFSSYGLFLDCSANPYLFGLLDFGTQAPLPPSWITFSTCDYKTDLHQFIFQELAKENLSLNSLNHIFVNHGPGSYTGLRQSFIFSETLKLSGKHVYTFYHYEALKIAKLKNYLDSNFYIANAFKNSFFFQDLRSDAEGLLLLNSELKTCINEDQKIVGKTHPEYEIHPHFKNIDKFYQGFPQIFNELKYEQFSKLKQIHYFRHADIEFPNFQKK
ncbi:MAG: hypothetical protein QE271_09730 [Bacteriovoracaceae bacterium]|nr:hypothetical protein [Bacteriovoracaceae bacterium]